MSKSTPKHKAKAVSPKTVSPKTKKTTAKPKTALKSIKAQSKIPVPSISTPSKTAPKTLKELHNAIESLQTRMKRTNTLTKKSVTALESAVTALDKRTRQKSSTDKAALTRKVNQLSSRLTEMVEQTQSSVNSELKTALENPSIDNLRSALSRADQRLTQAETVQAQAITKINRHLASMATAVDTRIAQEETARKSAIEALKSETEQKIELVEQDTAKAFNEIGDKIVELSDEINRRGEANQLSIREKISEIALQTQTDFEKYKSELENQLESVSQNTHDTTETRRLEHTIFGLTTRLEELENSVANMSPQSFTSPAEDIPTPLITPMAPAATPPQLTVVKTKPAPAIADAFTLGPQALSQPAPTIPPNPYAAAQPTPQPATQSVDTQQAPPAQDKHIPQEFDPRQFMRAGKQNTAQAQYTPPPVLSPIEVPAPVPAPPKAEDSLDFAPLPYDNPAYAEQNDTMADIRIGGDDSQTSFTPPKLTGRNIRLAALATGVAVIGLVGAKTFLGNSNKEDIQTPQFAQNEAVPQTPQTSAPVVIEPIGQYTDNKAPTVIGEAAGTLNSAASAGDSVAQFQLGLSYLEQGRTNEGVDLIRKAANQNQPAAQYRLAKLYEVGEGVSQDSNMARQLTERAARNGNRIAMHDLALYYAEGRGGVSAELPTAAKWFEKAAERGVVDSQFNLGVLFESGQGLPKSLTDAFIWYSIAATQGDQLAKKRVDVLTDTISPADLAAAQARITNFKPVKIDEMANGIFRNVAWAKPSADNTQQVTQIKDVQTLLTDLGYDIGGADGSMGPRTRAAIISFEQANGMPETGRVNAALLDRLELAAGA